MSEGIESYDTGFGASAANDLVRTVDDVVDAVALPVVGAGGGSGYESFSAAFADYRAALGDRVVEQQRVGGLIAAMMEGVHRRLGQTPAPAPVATGRIR